MLNDITQTPLPKNLEELKESLACVSQALELHRKGPAELSQSKIATIENWLEAVNNILYRIPHSTNKRNKADKAITKILGYPIEEDEYLAWYRLKAKGHSIPWTFDIACKALGLLASSITPIILPQDWDKITELLESHKQDIEERLAAIATKHEQLEVYNSVPNEQAINKLIRYEAHLERNLYKAMHELEALQDKRKGMPAPLGRLGVHGENTALI